MKRLLIVGAGGHGQVVKETVDALGKFERIEFLDDVNPKAIGKLEEMEKFRDHFDCIFPAVGNNELRRKIMENAKKLNYEVPVLVHPTAYVSPSAKLGEGTIVEAMAVIHTKAVVKEGCIIAIGTLIDHEAEIEKYTYISYGTTVKANAKVGQLLTIPSGIIVTKEELQNG